MIFSKDVPLWCLGFMSGTSMDGIDGGILKTDGRTLLEFGPKISVKFESTLQKKLFSLKGKHILSDEDYQIIREFTQTHIDLTLKIKNAFEKNHPKEQISLIGFHGQTLFHKPKNRQTLQVGDAELLATKTGIPVINQFRLNDLFHGGQGAPLIPIFHQALAQKTNLNPFIFINIGGVSNITYGNQELLLAGDSGPGGALVDDCCKEYFDIPFDQDGHLARKGQINNSLIQGFLKDPFFKNSFPKSLDRDHFNSFKEQVKNNLSSPHDALATLTFATVSSLLVSLKKLPSLPGNIYLMGGGAYNTYLKELLDQELSHLGCTSALLQDLDNQLDPLYVEAYGFAYLAVRTLYQLPISFPSTTGVSHPVSGGVLTMPTV